MARSHDGMQVQYGRWSGEQPVVPSRFLPGAKRAVDTDWIEKFHP
jgi:hypothetical protein